MISEVLKREIDDYADALRRSPLLEQARCGNVSPETVGRYLASVRYLLLQTPVHLGLARDLAEAQGAPALSRYFEQKLLEEQSHHAWADADLSLLRDLFGRPAVQEPTASIFALVENTRSLIERNPFLYLAYILFAEYFTVVIGPEWIESLEKYCGIPPAALTAVGRHVDLDKHHVIDGCREMDALVSDERLLHPMREALRGTMRHFSAFCDELSRSAA